jgi:hypothetical protein
MRNAYKILLYYVKERDHSRDLGLNDKIVFEMMLEKWNGKTWTGFNWFRIGTSGGLL